MHNIRIPRYENLMCSELGHDSPKHAGPRFFDHESVEYRFNAWGFRTHNLNKLDSNSILVIGDSYTLGMGENIDKCYTSILEKQLGRPVFNISLNGASNDWIARRTKHILAQVTPHALVIHYTFSHRRELDQSDWHDDERTLCEPTHTSAENFANWQQNFNSVIDAAGSIPVVHSFIPGWHDVDVDYASIPGCVLPPVALLDRARDGFHYGPKTHSELACKITNLLVL